MENKFLVCVELGNGKDYFYVTRNENLDFLKNTSSDDFLACRFRSLIEIKSVGVPERPHIVVSDYKICEVLPSSENLIEVAISRNCNRIYLLRFGKWFLHEVYNKENFEELC